MANLIDQINEMIDMLEVVNPAAAAQFRRGESLRDPAPVQPAPVVTQSRSIVQPKGRLKEGAQTHVTGLRQLKLNLSPGKMAEAVILAEIIGKPISKRRK